MAINYLKNPSTTAALSSYVQNSISNIPNAVTISNVLPSTSTVTGALVVSGGVGIGGNIYAAQLILSGGITANSASFTYGVAASSLSTTTIVNSGALTSTTANINSVTASNLFGANANIGTLINTGSITSPSAAITAATVTTLTGTTANVATVNATRINVGTLAVDNIVPNTDGTVNLGDVSKINIGGGGYNQILTTNGSGVLTWTDGPSALSTGYGITRTGNQIALTSVGATPGTYTQVTVNEYGQVLSGTTTALSLQNVTAAGSTTDQQVTFLNSTDSNDINTGAVVISGGLGVGLNLTTNSLYVLNDAIFESAFTATHGGTVTATLFLDGQANNEVPIRVTDGTLTPAPDLGSIEFDGDYLYVTTHAGRQVIQIRHVDLAPSYLLPVRATATVSITVSNPRQSIGSNNLWDGVVLNVYDRVLLQNQSNNAENGIYVWNGAGTPLTRSADANTTTGMYTGTLVVVTEGTLYGGSVWRLATGGKITVGTTPITFSTVIDLDTISLAQLPTDFSSGVVARSTYGSMVLRQVTSSSSFITVSNGDGAAGDITINTGTVPVASGGTGRTNFYGYLRGLGSTTTSSNTIPIASITGVGTMVLQNANSVAITGGNIAVTNMTAVNVNATNTNSTNISGGVITANTSLTAATATVTGNTTTNNLTVNNAITTSTLTANVVTAGNIAITGSVSLPNLFGNAVALGTNTAGTFTSNAITLLPTDSVTDSIAKINQAISLLELPFVDHGNDPSNWNLNVNFGLYAVKRSSWSATAGTPNDAWPTGLLTVLVSEDVVVQKYQPNDTTTEYGAEYVRTKVGSADWTGWARVVSEYGALDGGTF